MRIINNLFTKQECPAGPTYLEALATQARNSRARSGARPRPAA